MATAINFNWLVNEKMTERKVYDAIFTELSGTETALQMARENGIFKVWRVGSTACESVRVFRDGMRVFDALALTLKRAGHVRSGEVYKCDILCAISDEYQMLQIYNGVHYPSYDFSNNKPRKESAYYIGFELETTMRKISNAEDDDTRCALAAFRSNLWRMVTDSSIGSRGIEFVSTLLHPNDATNPSFFEPFCDMLTGLAKSSTDSSTGLHLHISREAFGETEAEQNDNIAKLVYLENYVLSSRALESLYGRGLQHDYCKRNESAAAEHVAALMPYAPRIMAADGIKDALCADFLRANKTRHGHDYGVDRYRRINVTNQHTIEFRQGKGQIKSTALANIAQHATTIAAYVRATAWHKLSANGYFKSIPTSNKYAELRRIFATTSDAE